MQQPRHKIIRREVRTDQQNRSLTLVHSQRKEEMQPYPADPTAKHDPSLSAFLLDIPLVRFAFFVQKVLSFFISHFVINVIFRRRQVAQRQQQERAAPGEVRVKSVEVEQKGQELLRADQIKDQFLMMASHELKTPMTTIVGHAQLMLRRLAKQPELSSELVVIRTALERIDGQTRRLNSLVDELLDLDTLRAGKLELQFSQCDVVDMCCDVIEEQRFLTGRTFELDIPPTPVLIQADGDRLRQVMVNLIGNAVKYSPKESIVKVSIGWNGIRAIITIADSGTGIPIDQQAPIFEPFYRGPGAKQSAISGLGLGLTICKEIVERHHGNIWCESREGEGSTFFVELPRYQREAH